MRRILTFSLFLFAFYSQIYAQNTSTYTVYFDSDSDIISSENETTLDVIFTIGNITKILIEGHTDSEGNEAYNRDLSQRRADAVRRYLVNQGLAADLMSTSSFGENIPVTQNRTDDGKQKNRRVVVTVFFDIPQENPVIEPPQIEEIIVEERPTPPPVNDSIYIDNSLLNKILARQLESEFFKINNQRDTMIRTQSGILFYFNKDIFEGDCAEEITIKVTDYSSRRKAILANAPTLSNGRLLYSAGMFEIRAFCGDIPIDVKEGKEYNIFFPIRDDVPAVRKFKGFYGERDSLSDVMNWELASTNPLPIVNGNAICRGSCNSIGFDYEKCFFDRFFMTAKRKRKIQQAQRRYYRLRREQNRFENIDFDAIRNIPDCGVRYFEFAGRKMRFVNCDAFWDVPSSKRVNVLVEAAMRDNTKIHLVFRSRMSVMNPVKTYKNSSKFKSVPSNEDVWVVGTKINENGKPMLALKKANTSDKRISLEFEEVENEEEMAQVLKKVNL